MNSELEQALRKVEGEHASLREMYGDVSSEPCTLEVGQSKSGLYLSTQQIDLLLLVNVTTPSDLINFVRNCVQIKHENFGDITESNLEEKKKEVFDAYKKSFISFRELVPRAGFSEADSMKMRIKYNLERNLPKELIPGALEALSKGGEKGLIKFIFESGLANPQVVLNDISRFISNDYENIQSISYDEILELDKLIKRDPTIESIVGMGATYNMSMHYLGNGERAFDPYYMDRVLLYAKMTQKHVRMHSLFDRSTAIEFKDRNYSRDKVLKELKGFVEGYLEYLQSHDEVLFDQTRLINCAEIFNELLGYKTEKYGAPDTSMVWEAMFGIKLEQLLDMVVGRIPEGVDVMYNETALEEGEHRLKACDGLITRMGLRNPGFINVFGNQLHVYDSLFKDGEYTKMEASAAFLAKVANEYGIRVQITEHDLNINPSLISNCNKFGVSKEYIMLLKRHYQKKISETLREAGVPLESVDYWSIFDRADHNYRRVIEDKIAHGKDTKDIDSLSAGLLPRLGSVEKIKSLNPQELERRLKRETVKVKKPEFNHESGYVSVTVALLVMIAILLVLIGICLLVM